LKCGDSIAAFIFRSEIHSGDTLAALQKEVPVSVSSQVEEAKKSFEEAKTEGEACFAAAEKAR